jgi:hypothetical protein
VLCSTRACTTTSIVIITIITVAAILIKPVELDGVCVCACSNKRQNQ